MTLRTEELLLVEQRRTGDSKATWFAFLPWFAFGLVGGHRFHVDHKVTGLVFALWFIFSFLMQGVHPAVGGALLMPLALKWLIDAFQLPAMVRAANTKMRANLIAEAERDRLPGASPNSGLA